MPFIPVRGRISVTYVQHYTLPDKLCDFCTTFIPLPDSSVTSVGTSYRYPGMGYTFHTRTRGRSVTSVQQHTLAEKLCDFCKTFIPLPDSSVTSATNLIPYRKYPYPTEHNLDTLSVGFYIIFYKTVFYGVQIRVASNQNR